jgi:hypothetical protein
MLKLNLFYLLLILSGLLAKDMEICAQDNPELKKLERIVKLSWFIDWSQNKSFSSDKKIIYVMTDNKSAVNFQSVSKNNVIFKEWEIICINKITNIQEGSVVFITKNKEQFTDWIIKISMTKDIFTISENSDNFCNRGGMINIVENSGQINFELNYKIIQNKSIDISSKLLALSKICE